jgi:hypothetical protein
LDNLLTGWPTFSNQDMLFVLVRSHADFFEGVVMVS